MRAEGLDPSCPGTWQLAYLPSPPARQNGWLRAATPDLWFDTTWIWQTEPRATGRAPPPPLPVQASLPLVVVAEADMHIRSLANHRSGSTRTLDLVLACSQPLIPSPSTSPSSSDPEITLLCALARRPARGLAIAIAIDNGGRASSHQDSTSDWMSAPVSMARGCSCPRCYFNPRLSDPMQPARWPVPLRPPRSHLPFPIEHQKHPGLHFEPSASPSGCHGGVFQHSRNNSKGQYQGCFCVLGTPCKYFDPPRHPHGHGHGCSSAPPM